MPTTQTRRSRRRQNAVLRNLVRELRATRKAEKAVATGQPQAASTHLIAVGVDVATAHRFAGAFSRNVLPTASATTKVKLTKRSRKTKRVAVKLYSIDTFQARLAVYRPKDPTAAAQFAAIAA